MPILHVKPTALRVYPVGVAVVLNSSKYGIGIRSIVVNVVPSQSLCSPPAQFDLIHTLYVVLVVKPVMSYENTSAPTLAVGTVFSSGVSLALPT